MKVLLCAYECDPNRGSEYGRSWSWLSDYIREGHEVCCLTSKRGEDSIRKYLMENELENVSFHFVKANNFLEEKYGQGTLYTYGHYLLWLQKAYSIAKELAKETQFDFAHHVSWGSLQLGTFLWRLDIPFVYGPLGGGQYAPKVLKPFFLQGWSLEVKRELISKLLLKLNHNTRKGVRKARCVIVVNEETRDLALKFGASSVKMMVDTNIKKADIITKAPSKRKVPELKLIWVGRLLYRKGLPLVLQAMAKVDTRLPITLSIYGDGPFGQDLPKYIQELNVGHKTNWHGQVPMEKLRKAYEEHDVFVFCTLRESLGVQFFEAMSNGLPVIALDIHGAKTAIPENAGIKLPLRQQPDKMVEALAEAIERLYHDEKKRSAMGRAALEHLQQLSKVNRVDVVLSALNKAAVSHQSGQ